LDDFLLYPPLEECNHADTRSKLNRFLDFLALALASAQLDSAQLRVKFGTPFHREVFRIPQGFDLVVDYEASHQVCMLQVLAVMPTDSKVQNSDEMKEDMAFLGDLVRDSMRGKETGRHVFVAGAFSLSTGEYEQVAISETEYANQPTVEITR